MKFTPFLGVAMVAAALSMAGCKRSDEPVGPAQKAGAAIDKAGEKVADKLHENLEKANQVGDQMAEAARNTGQEIDKATGEASRGIDRATEQVGKKVERAGEKIQDAAKSN